MATNPIISKAINNNDEEVIDTRDKTKLIDAERSNDRMYSSFGTLKESPTNSNTSYFNSGTRNCPTCNGKHFLIIQTIESLALINLILFF